MNKKLICDGAKIKHLAATALKCFEAIVGNPPNHNFRHNNVDEILFVMNTLNIMVDNYVKNEPVVFGPTFILQRCNDTHEESEEPEQICPKCSNSEINEGDKFCKICGLPVAAG
ncbi:MAG: hypothetical protein H6Q72_4202 [Firmicutes bacterium]|nr:hypothetical protein [Bacillota bacterium]